MRVLSESWCFCNGGGKSERLKSSIFSTKSPAMARLSSSGGGGVGGEVSGTGFLIHRTLLLTTHANLPSVAAAEFAEIRLQNGVAATLVPHRFFITSSVLDLTIVGLDSSDGDAQSHFLKTCSKPNLDLGSCVYLLGYTQKPELTIGEGKVVIATDNLIKLSTDGITRSPGSAGFDSQGNLAFMICDPMKLATSPNTKSSSTSSSSSSSWKKDFPMQFGIPMPVICDWLNQHWEGSLDELSKPKLPLIRLVSAGHRSEHSCASFTMRQVFKSPDAEIDRTPTSSITISKPREHPGPSCSAAARTLDEGKDVPMPWATAHVQGIPTPEIYESAKVTAIAVRKKENTQVQLLDINFPPRLSKAASASQFPKEPFPCSGENCLKDSSPQSQPREENEGEDEPAEACPNAEVSSTGSVNGARSEVQSSSSPNVTSEVREGGNSEEETMYSAETAESRNYTSPREGKYRQQVGRSQSCVNYNRWAVHKYPAARRSSLENQRSFTTPRKTYSHGAAACEYGVAAASHRSNDYFSPTVSSIMKKRNNMEPPNRLPRQAAGVHFSPRWMF
ncbi:hypothetical protein Nepgr_022245 [Nepenthes gracilis]|uniref:Uncharacterized protein n=1 Tax=Nepenthes gracilis TaxID=150966 RepID=A0AAD3T0I6_NEPGR|nr:hypothetical protein Nepgr_022245 [Nepenthes gracilis]